MKVSASALDAWQLIGRPEVAPADAGRTLVDKGGVSMAFPVSTLVLGSVLRRCLVAPYTLAVKGHAPAAAPYTVVTLRQPREIWPGRSIQRLYPEACHDLPRH
jgi:hypothetical protein